MGFFKKKSNKEIAEELRELKVENTKMSGREKLERQLKEAKERNFRQKHPNLIKAGKGIAAIAKDIAKEQSKKKKKKGGSDFGFNW